MSPHLPPHHLVPNAKPLDMLVVCADASCGRCYRCEVIATTKAATAQLLAEKHAAMAQHAHAMALVVIYREALRSAAHKLEAGSVASLGLLQLVDLTPQEAHNILRGIEATQDEPPASAPTYRIGMDTAAPGTDHVVLEVATEIHPMDGVPAPSFDLGQGEQEEPAHD